MLTLPLEPTDDRANPLFKNAESCAQWLKQLQLDRHQPYNQNNKNYLYLYKNKMMHQFLYD